MTNTSKGGIDVTKIVGIVSGVIIILALLTYFAFTDWVASQTPIGQERYASPIINQLPLLLTFVGGTIGAFIGNAVISGKIAKKVEKIEKQTNGRTHVRDAQMDVLVAALAKAHPRSASVTTAAEKAIGTSPNNDHPPEDSYTEKEAELQARIITLTTQLSEYRNSQEKE